ncbi:MAG: hypothetical protein AABY16_00435 [Nanoarchaeota archaeon]
MHKKKTSKPPVKKRRVRKVRFGNLNQLLMGQEVSLKIRDEVIETYETVTGIYRGIYVLDCGKMVAIDVVVDERNPTYLERQFYWREEISRISFSYRPPKKE